MQLSTHFNLSELVHSTIAKQKGIKNEPNESQVENLKRLCNEILEPVRAKLNVPLYISSGYRCERLNSAIGGSRSSQHCYGQAADIEIYHKTLTNKDLFDLCVEMIRSGEITVGQLIWEGGEDIPQWVHISTPYKRTNQILRMRQVYDKHYGKYKNVYEDITEKYL